MTRATVTFSSPLTPSLKPYVDLKRALGQRFYIQTRTLVSLDRFLYDHALNYPDLNAAAFRAWCQTQEHVASGVRRVRMQQVHNFCLYRRRTEPHCFVPDPALFPKLHQRLQPYIFSEQEVARLLRAASAVKRLPSSPLRPDVIRLAIVLLFTTGIRRGELQRLALGDYNRRDATLLIRETKFYKSRLLPLNSNIAEELERYVRARAQRRLPISSNTALLWNALKGGRAYHGTTLARWLEPLLRQCAIFTPKQRLPRIHDFRHYVPCLTMSRNGEPLQLLPGEIRSPPTKPADMTRHSFLLAADSSGRRGVSPQLYSDPVVHAARMFSKLSPSWQSSLPDEFVGFQLVRDQATRRVEPARESSPGCNSARAGIFQRPDMPRRGVLRDSRQNSLGVKHTAHDGPVSTGTGLLE